METCVIAQGRFIKFECSQISRLVRSVAVIEGQFRPETEGSSHRPPVETRQGLPQVVSYKGSEDNNVR